MLRPVERLSELSVIGMGLRLNPEWREIPSGGIPLVEREAPQLRGRVGYVTSGQ